jgi:hypothetical protein
LKDPPEIWDLVHEAPRNFNAASAFVARLTSIQTTLPFRIAVVIVVSIACAVGALMLRGSQARSVPVEAQAIQNAAAATEVSAPVSLENTPSEMSAVGAPEADQFSHHSESPSVDEKPARKPVLSRQIRSRVVSDEESLVTAPNVPTAQSREVPAAAPVIAPPQVQHNSASNKPNNSLSPQLIAPAKTAPPKGKVIQWP